jgi:hypothetical protein
MVVAADLGNRSFVINRSLQVFLNGVASDIVALFPLFVVSSVWTLFLLLRRGELLRSIFAKPRGIYYRYKYSLL